MLLSHRHTRQLQALALSLLLAALLFLFLFFRLNISLFGIKIPEIHQEDQSPRQQQQATPTRVIWQPQQSGYQSQQSSTRQIQQTAPAAPTTSDQQQASQTQQAPSNDQQSPTEPPSQQSTSQPREQPKSTPHAQRKSRTPTETATTAESTSKTTKEQRRRTNKSKWYKRHESRNQHTSSHTHRTSKQQQLYHALQKHTRETQLASAQPTASGDVYGTSHASENATAVAYETFAGKSDMAIVRASHQMQYYVYTAEYLRSTMQVTYTSNRRGALTHLTVTASSGNEAIDNAILNIIRSADLPPLPPEHKEDSITRTITIMIHKAPGSDPVILYVNRQ